MTVSCFSLFVIMACKRSQCPFFMGLVIVDENAFISLSI